MSTHPSGRGVDVLIVDDEVELRQLLAELLADNGYSAHTARDGSAALHYLASNPPPALIILDIMMRPMDGMTFLAQMPAHLASVPVIVWTASHRVTADPPPQARRLFTKPVDMRQLLAAVRDLIG